MPYVDSNGKIVDKPQGILQGYSFDGFLGGILTIIAAIIAFFQSMISPLFGNSDPASSISRFFGRGGNNDRRGGSGGGSGGNGGNGGGGGGGGGRGNRPIGRLNTSSMDMSSCPTGGCSGGGCG